MQLSLSSSFISFQFRMPHTSSCSCEGGWGGNAWLQCPPVAAGTTAGCVQSSVKKGRMIRVSVCASLIVEAVIHPKSHKETQGSGGGGPLQAAVFAV